MKEVCPLRLAWIWGRNSQVQELTSRFLFADFEALRTRGLEHPAAIECVARECEREELASAVRTKSVSALELTDAAIARIEALDGPINAVVVRDFDRARDQARQVDLAVAKGADLPLAGVPMTVKGTFNVAGLPTTLGLEFAKDYRGSAAPKGCGRCHPGQDQCPVSLSDYQSDNLIYGPTNNPHDLTRWLGAPRAVPRPRLRRAWSPRTRRRRWRLHPGAGVLLWGFRAPLLGRRHFPRRLWTAWRRHRHAGLGPRMGRRGPDGAHRGRSRARA
jgi:Amidase